MEATSHNSKSKQAKERLPHPVLTFLPSRHLNPLEPQILDQGHLLPTQDLSISNPRLAQPPFHTIDRDVVPTPHTTSNDIDQAYTSSVESHETQGALLTN